MMTVAKLEICQRISSSMIVFLRLPNHKRKFCSGISTYVQGQNPEDDEKSREYFYYIDHQGMLFLDDSRMKNFTSCFKEKKFLKFFFSRIRLNDTNRYKEFPFLSPCGRERNFIRCDDLPIVFTHLIEDTKSGAPNTYLSFAHAGDDLRVTFEPDKLYMMPETGRVYHPAPEKTGGVGLVRSKLAIHLSSYFVFKNGELNPPTHFQCKGEDIELTQDISAALRNLKNIRQYSLGLENT